MKKILILGSIIVTLISCNSTQYLHEPGTYTIKQRDGDMTQFIEVNGTYSIVSDTLKKNDKIVINVVKVRPFKRAGRQKMI